MGVQSQARVRNWKYSDCIVCSFFVVNISLYWSVAIIYLAQDPPPTLASFLCLQNGMKAFVWIVYFFLTARIYLQIQSSSINMSLIVARYPASKTLSNSCLPSQLHWLLCSREPAINNWALKKKTLAPWNPVAWRCSFGYLIVWRPQGALPRKRTLHSGVCCFNARSAVCLSVSPFCHCVWGSCQCTLPVWVFFSTTNTRCLSKRRFVVFRSPDLSASETWKNLDK